VVAAHPDDEVLGMGGTIARHTACGDAVHVVFLGDGVSSRGNVEKALLEERKSCALRACKILGANVLSFEALPDNQFDSVPLLSVVKTVEEVKKATDPQVIYTHHAGDLNIDHRVVCQAVLTAFRPLPSETFGEIRAFEVNSSTEWGGRGGLEPFVPDTYVDISPYLSKLEESCRCYSKEIRKDPHARSMEAVRYSAFRRGREVGVYAAEAFMTLRRILRNA